MTPINVAMNIMDRRVRARMCHMRDLTIKREIQAAEPARPLGAHESRAGLPGFLNHRNKHTPAQNPGDWGAASLFSPIAQLVRALH